MKDAFEMNEAQPRILDETRQGVIGAPLDRVDGPLKVTGRATYAAEFPVENLAHGALVRATIARGRVSNIDGSSIAGIPGLIRIVYTENFVRSPAQGMANEAPIRPLPEVHYHGQPIALVVAETFEAAREAAERLVVDYAEEPGAPVDPETAPAEVNDDASPSFGNLDRAMAEADVTLDETFTTAGHAAAAMEPHASIAVWQDGRVTLYGAYQMPNSNRNELADALDIPAEKVRIVSNYVGGGFGSKLGIGPEAVAAAVAARDLGRPVRVVMARQTVFDSVLRRTETVQRLRLAAGKDGRLTGIGHEDRISNAPGEEFAEPVSTSTHLLYGGDNRFYEQRIARTNMLPSGSVRAPGEAVGMLALECAMDELAERLQIDPIELRLRNVPERHPEDDIPYTARALEDCLRQGADRFGWSDRQAPRARRDGDWFTGIGMAAAARPNMLVPAAARITLTGAGAVVETDMTDIGTGSYTILCQIAAEMLGLDPAQVEVRLGDTDYPATSGSGGSFGANSSGSAVFLAARDLRRQIAGAMDCSEDDLTLQDGVARCGNRERPLSEIAAEPLTALGEIKPGDTSDAYCSAGFGAHFAEVRVHALTGEVRVTRMLGLFGAGRILNQKTARSQCIGGMLWGLGSALTEELQHDPRDGHVVSRDLANYHVACNLDAPLVEVDFLEERDDQTTPIQTKGVGELGISGAGAAIFNAVHNACGVRLRDFPATPDRVIAALEAAGY
ncbi:xanthine dehydrogenase family protein molybdopterin-binding subunit [Roseivivax sp. CAU 1761]